VLGVVVSALVFQSRDTTHAFRHLHALWRIYRLLQEFRNMYNLLLADHKTTCECHSRDHISVQWQGIFKMTVFCYAVPCSLVNWCYCFEGSCYLRFQGIRWKR
jgi:hypothetical protein